MLDLTIRQRVAALVLLIFLVIGGILLYINQNRGFTKEYRDDVSVNQIYVHVCGAVVKPGVIGLKPGTRKFEAIEKAGGALPEADFNRINLAEFVEDGEQLYLPKHGEIIEIPAKKRGRSQSSTSTTAKGTKSQGTQLISSSKPIDLNSASLKQLEAIPGVGPFLASKIIEYRNQHGRFQNVDELEHVYGIGQSKLEKIKPFVTVP